MPQGRPQPALAVAWQSDASARHWQFTLRHGVKFHDGSAASAGSHRPDSWRAASRLDRPRPPADSLDDRQRHRRCPRCSPNSRCRAISFSSATRMAFPSAPDRSASPSGNPENFSSSPPTKKAGPDVLSWTRSKSNSANRCATRPSPSNSDKTDVIEAPHPPASNALAARSHPVVTARRIDGARLSPRTRKRRILACARRWRLPSIASPSSPCF